MNGSEKQKRRKKKVTQVPTFSVHFNLEEIKDNLNINTHTHTPSKRSKEQIINQAFKFHS